MTKFSAGDDIDQAHCIALRHEILRCKDSFDQFSCLAETMILQGRTPEISYRTYNAYTAFIHHLYEFLMGCLARDSGRPQITNKKGEDSKILSPTPCIRWCS